MQKYCKERKIKGLEDHNYLYGPFTTLGQKLGYPTYLCAASVATKPSDNKFCCRDGMLTLNKWDTARVEEAGTNGRKAGKGK